MALIPVRTVAGGALTGQVRLVQSSNSAVYKKNDFSGVVVWLTAADEPFRHTSRKHAQMVQKNKKFSPHILPVEVDTSVDFPNEDPIFHNAFSNFNGQIFDVALYPPGTSRTVRFDKPGIVRVFCNIHPSMSAIIVVLESHFFTTTDHEGRYSLANVSPGNYRLHFFHERATPETLEKSTRAITIGSDSEELESATISEAGYLPVSHKNKYGQDYPPGGDNAGDGYSLPVK